MTVLATGASVLAHGVHYAVLAGGLAGLVALLGPSLAARPRAVRLDVHDRRVAALREHLHLESTLAPPVRFETAVGTRERLVLPLAVVSSAAAAGVHAAVGPAHFREQLAFGTFFAAAAVLQLLWAAAVAVRPSRAALLLGAGGNLAVLALWLTSRTVGLPFGLLPRPEAVGPWDLACAAWEAVVVVTCCVLLRADGRLRLPTWWSWHHVARLWAGTSVLALALLSLGGAHA